MDDKIRFKRKIHAVGDSFGLTIPRELISFLDMNKGDEITIIADVNSKGQRYGAFFKAD